MGRISYTDRKCRPVALRKKRSGGNALLRISVFSLLSASPVALGAAQNSTCTGADCLRVLRIRHGTKCGLPESVEVDVQNVSSSLYLRGYVTFKTPKGPIQEATGLVPPGRRENFYVCSGMGEPTIRANTAPDNNVRYPSRRPETTLDDSISSGQSALVFCNCDEDPADSERKCNVAKLECNQNVFAICRSLARVEGTPGTIAYQQSYDPCVKEGMFNCSGKRSQCLTAIRRCPVNQVCNGCTCKVPPGGSGAK